MSTHTVAELRSWLDNCGGWRPGHDLAVLRRGIGNGLLNVQNEYGSTALSLAVGSDWLDGVRALLDAQANTELRYFRTGETPLYGTMLAGNERMVSVLVKAGANPDAGDHWGVTPRQWVKHRKMRNPFARIPVGPVQMPAPHIQNAEHLADHYHPRFKIPDREERETMRVGQAVSLYVYGPKNESKQDTVKVRITKRTGRRPNVRYSAALETPVKQTHLAPDTTEVTFGPEHIATVWIARTRKKQ